VRLRRVRPDSWWFDVALVVAFGLVTVLLAAKNPLLRVDLAVRDFADAHRPAGLYWALRVFNYLGQGGQVLTPLAVIAAFIPAVRRRTVRLFLPVVAAFVLTYVTIGPLKLWTDRAAPSSPIQHPEWLFHDSTGLSYPSGHVVNAIVWYGVLALLLQDVLRSWLLLAIRYGVPAIVLFTTTYLSFHWLSDGLAGILIGVLLDRILRRVPWDDIPFHKLRRRREKLLVSGRD
jgi:membrane-associated phospholipid phosphatase